MSSVPFVTPKDPGPPPKRTKHWSCPCSLPFCQNGEIPDLLATAGCSDLLGRRRVAFIESPTTHKERKLYAFRKCLEFHLMVPKGTIQQKKAYEVSRFHWSLPLLKLNLSTITLLSPATVRDIDKEQTLLIGNFRIFHSRQEEYIRNSNFSNNWSIRTYSSRKS